MFTIRSRTALMGAAIAFGSLAGAASAATLEVTFTNQQTGAGLFLTPVLSVFHNGYDAFDAGSSASAALEALAEEGMVGGLQTEAEAAGATTSVITAPGGFPGAPVIDPGEAPRITVDVDPVTSQYFSFFSMVIPSNDAFIGNDDPFAYRIFDAAGEFAGPVSISIFGGNIWDAGTEVNFDNGSGAGAAFAVNGGPPGSGTPENGVIALAGNVDYLFGTQIPTGGTIGSVPGNLTLLGTIDVDLAPIPLPAGMPLLLAGLGGLAVLKRRKRIQ
ncbi:MAG: spondin domain-containing protein [Pseudomonadota bacterium]